MPGTQLNANVGHLEQSSPEVITWSSLTPTGFGQCMCTLLRIEVYLLDRTGCLRDLSDPRQDSASY